MPANRVQGTLLQRRVSFLFGIAINFSIAVLVKSRKPQNNQSTTEDTEDTEDCVRFFLCDLCGLCGEFSAQYHANSSRHSA